MVLLTSCDAEYKFTWVDIGASGSENDAGIFKRSQIKHNMITVSKRLNEKDLPGTRIKIPHYFVGDEAFPLNQFNVTSIPRYKTNGETNPI